MNYPKSTFKYQVKKVEINHGNASTQFIPFLFDDVAQCHHLINLMNDFGNQLKDWEIIKSNGGLEEEVVDRSDAYKKLLQKDADDRALWLKAQYAKTTRINRMPTKFHSTIEELNEKGFKITYIRSKAEFNPHMSSRVKWSLQVLINDKEIRWGLPWEYVTKSGQVQVKKFANDMFYFFGDRKNEIDPEVIRSIVTEYEEIKRAIDRA